MLLENFLNKKFKFGGFILEDANSRKYTIGKIDTNKKTLTLKLLKKDLILKLTLLPELYLGEEYFKGNIEVKNGSILDFLNLVLHPNNFGRGKVNAFSAILNFLRYSFNFLTKHNFIGISKRNAIHHYSRGEDIYDWMLDTEHRQYSCAYFKDVNESLEQAQTNKLDLVLKKLVLKPSDTVLDIGCGWGGLSRYLHKKMGCRVHGISLAPNQIEYCKKKARELHMDNALSYSLCDYRQVTGKWRRIVNVGFLEHLSPKFLSVFFSKVNELLTDDGLCLTHTIASVEPPSPTNPFIGKWIFPGGKVPTASQLTRAIEKSGLIISGFSSLIDHYNLTLEKWRFKFLDNADKAKEKYGEDFVRLWDFYLSSTSSAFRSNLLVHQIETVKNFNTVPHRTREYIYS